MWCIVPIAMLIAAPSGVIKDLYEFDGSFGGLSYHRNVYGFYAGLTVLLMWFIDLKRKHKLILSIILLIGLTLSESRTSILALSIAYFYLLIKDNDAAAKVRMKVKRYIPLVVIVTISIIAYLINYGTRSNDMLVTSDRSEIYMKFLGMFLSNIFWGRGEPTTFISYGTNEVTPVHNFILQVLVDYGLFTSIMFVLLLFLVWKKSGLYSRVLYLYLFIVGLFQPYFTFGFPTYFTLIIMLLSNSFPKAENLIEGSNIKKISLS
jgi:hypothetical protein